MKVLILGEHDQERLTKATRQALSAAGQLGDTRDLLLIGHGLENVAATARALRGVSRVLLADAPHLAHPLAEEAAMLIRELAAGYGAIIAAHSAFARSVLPRVAAMLDVAMLSEVIEIQGDRAYLRPIYAGRLHLATRSSDPIQILTVRGSRFAAAEAEDAALAEMLALTGLSSTFSRARRLGGSGRGPTLGSARVVVAGGRALGSAAQFRELLTPLAELLGGTLGASRSAVDAGYAPNAIQIGQTGAIIAPELYLAIGISGAVQHTAGIKDSKTIIAINKDPEAPIFELADYALTADLFKAVPALIEALRAQADILAEA